MLSHIIMRRLFLAPRALRPALIHPKPFQPIHPHHYSSVLPVIEPSFWAKMIPKPLRRSPNCPSKTKKQKTRNPATFYIWIFLLIGSMSIQMIALKLRFKNYMNRADARISLLKEVIERVQKGEEIRHVEGLLGRGNKQQEREWEEILKEAENEAELFKKTKKSMKVENATRVDESTPQRESSEPKKMKSPLNFY